MQHRLFTNPFFPFLSKNLVLNFVFKISFFYHHHCLVLIYIFYIDLITYSRFFMQKPFFFIAENEIGMEA